MSSNSCVVEPPASREDGYLKGYRDTILHDGSHAHLGDTLIEGGLHVHFHPTTPELSLLAVIQPLFDVGSKLSQIHHSLSMHPNNEVHAQELTNLLVRLPKIAYLLRPGYESARLPDISSPVAQRLNGLALRASECARELRNDLENLVSKDHTLWNERASMTQADAEALSTAFLLLWEAGDIPVQLQRIQRLQENVNSCLSLHLDQPAFVNAANTSPQPHTFLQVGRSVSANPRSVRPVEDLTNFKDFLEPEIDHIYRESVHENHTGASLEDTPRRAGVAQDYTSSRGHSNATDSNGSSRQKPPIHFSVDYTDKIKSLLHFRESSHRRIEIKPAHKKTFDWILHECRNSQAGTFCSWLRDDNGSFWINGKAGSGKSTLMKYLYQHEKFRDLISTWAGRRRLVICTFFFWYAGTPLQKSQEGLLRSILCEILEATPTLAPILFPQLSRHIFYNGLLPGDCISMAELLEAIQILKTNMPHNMALFIMIDGVDEYLGSHLDLSRFLVELTANPSIKLLASSRPITECAQVFSRCPSLRLQDITVRDVRAYVQYELIRDDLFKRLARRESQFCLSVENTLIEKASGVFLWIVLVVRQLIIGLGNYDDPGTLKETIDELPEDLEHLYHHMFQSMKTQHKAEASRIFQLVLHARVAQADIGITALQLYVAMQNPNRIQQVVLSDNYDEVAEYIDVVEGKLRSRCCGLVEVQYTSVYGVLMQPIVGFLHRTVYDFLRDESVWPQVIKDHQIGSIDLNLSLLAGGAHVMRCRASAWIITDLDDVQDLLAACMFYSAELSRLENREHLKYLAMADSCAIELMQKGSEWYRENPSMAYFQACQSAAALCRYPSIDKGDVMCDWEDVYGISLLMIASLRLHRYFKGMLRRRSSKSLQARAMLTLLKATSKAADLSPSLESYLSSIKLILESEGYEGIQSMNILFSGMSPWTFWVAACRPCAAHLQITLDILRAIRRENQSNDKAAVEQLKMRGVEEADARVQVEKKRDEVRKRIIQEAEVSVLMKSGVEEAEAEAQISRREDEAEIKALVKTGMVQSMAQALVKERREEAEALAKLEETEDEARKKRGDEERIKALVKTGTAKSHAKVQVEMSRKSADELEKLMKDEAKQKSRDEAAALQAFRQHLLSWRSVYVHTKNLSQKMLDEILSLFNEGLVQAYESIREEEY